MRDLNVISFNSFSLCSLTDLKPRFANSGFAGASNALLVIIPTALFCSLWSLFMSVVLQHPQTEEQYLKSGSTMLLYTYQTSNAYKFETMQDTQKQIPD